MEPRVAVWDAGQRDRGGIEGQTREGESFAKRALTALENPSRSRGQFFGVLRCVAASPDRLGDVLDRGVGRAFSGLDVLPLLRLTPGLNVQGGSVAVEGITWPYSIEGASSSRFVGRTGNYLAAWSSRLRLRLVLDEHDVLSGNHILGGSTLLGGFDGRLGLTDGAPDSQSRPRRSRLVGGL